MSSRGLKLLLVATLFSACVPSLSGLPDKAAARAVCDRAMEKILADDIPGAFAILKGEWSAVLPEVDTLVVQTVTQRSVLGPRYGEPVGVVFIREEEIPDLLLRLTYVEKRGNHGLRWQFTFYRPNDVWLLNGVKWDDQLANVLEP